MLSSLFNHVFNEGFLKMLKDDFFEGTLLM